jgi:hypothetical protein
MTGQPQLASGGARWRTALTWGFGAALAHRLLLTIWMAAIWTLVSGNLPDNQIDFHNTADLPSLSETEGRLLGVWRRWDAVHYLDLALNGYRLENIGATVFSPLAPALFRAADLLVPGGVDLAAALVQTIAFGAALTLLHRFISVYYEEPALAPWGVGVMALLPISFYFAAPMTESIYLALTLAALYAAVRQRWRLAAVCGLLAALARSQGALLIGAAGLILLEQVWDGRWTRESLWQAAKTSVQRGWMLAIMPLAVIGFQLYRSSLGLPPLDTVFLEHSYVTLVSPMEGILLCLRYIVTRPDEAVRNLDVWAFGISFLLGVGLLISRRHRRAPLIAYTFSFWAVYTGKMNYYWGTDEPFFVQSFARYTLALFPIWVLVADGLRHGGFWVRIAGVGALMLALAFFSALFPLALVGP